jgi:hypothetical protein
MFVCTISRRACAAVCVCVCVCVRAYDYASRCVCTRACLYINITLNTLIHPLFAALCMYIHNVFKEQFKHNGAVIFSGAQMWRDSSIKKRTVACGGLICPEITHAYIKTHAMPAHMPNMPYMHTFYRYALDATQAYMQLERHTRIHLTYRKSQK